MDKYKWNASEMHSHSKSKISFCLRSFSMIPKKMFNQFFCWIKTGIEELIKEQRKLDQFPSYCKYLEIPRKAWLFNFFYCHQVCTIPMQADCHWKYWRKKMKRSRSESVKNKFLVKIRSTTHSYIALHLIR